MAIKLIVIEPFGAYAKGQEITDQKEIKAIQAGESAAHVVAVQVPATSAKN